MNRAVQPPARDTTIRYPSSPAAGGTQAKGCQPRSACRLIARVVPTCGVVPWTCRTIAACSDGRSTVIGTLRSSSHGQIASAVERTSIQNTGEVTRASPNGRWSTWRRRQRKC